MATKTLSVVISGDSSGAQRAFRETGSSADSLESKIKAAGDRMVSAGKALSIGITAPVVAFAALGFSELAESGKVAAQTEAAIRSTGGAANVTAKQVNNLAGALMEKSGTDDEAIQSGENLLLTFTNIRNEAGKGNDIFNQATKASLDLSVAFGKDMTDSAILVGKALNDPIKGVTALQRVGVSFTEQQKEQIKALVETGDTMGAQKVILEELNKEVGGSAEAYGKTLPGQIAIAREELNNAAGEMVAVAAPAVKFLSGGVRELAGFLSDLTPAEKEAVGAIAGIAAATGPALIVLGKLSQALGEGGSLRAGLSTLGDAFVGVERGVVNAVAAFEQMDKAQLLTNIGITGGLFAIGALVVALESTDGPYERAAAAAERWGKAQINNAKASGDEFRSLMSTYKSLEANIDDLSAAQKFYSNAIQEGQPGAQNYRQDLDQVSQALLEAQAKHKALTPEIARLRSEMQAAKAEEEAQKAGLQGVSSGMTNLAGTTDAGRQAIQNFNNTLISAAGGPLAYQAAVASQASAQQALNDAINQYGIDSPQAQAAALALQQAQLGVSQAASQQDQAEANLIQSLVKGKVSYEDQIALLNQQLALHPENAAGIDLEKAALDRAKAAADAIPGSKSITITADTSQAHQAITDVQLAAIGLTREDYTVMINVGGDALGYLSISDRRRKRDLVAVAWT